MFNIYWLSYTQHCASHCHMHYFILFSQKFCEVDVVYPLCQSVNWEMERPCDLFKSQGYDLNKICWWVQYPSLSLYIFQISFKSIYIFFKNILYIFKTCIEFILLSWLYLHEFRQFSKLDSYFSVQFSNITLQ